MTTAATAAARALGSCALAVRPDAINHFFFVPVTIGLVFLTALLQTAWYRGRRAEYCG